MPAGYTVLPARYNSNCRSQITSAHLIRGRRPARHQCANDRLLEVVTTHGFDYRLALVSATHPRLGTTRRYRIEEPFEMTLKLGNQTLPNRQRVEDRISLRESAISKRDSNLAHGNVVAILEVDGFSADHDRTSPNIF